jgi:hypothetical protein
MVADLRGKNIEIRRIKKIEHVNIRTMSSSIQNKFGSVKHDNESQTKIYSE